MDPKSVLLGLREKSVGLSKAQTRIPWREIITWKLIDSIDGAKSSAIIYSITETAKANNLNPFRYPDHVLTVLKDHQDDTDYSFIEKLLPWSDQLPEICRSKSKTTNL